MRGLNNQIRTRSPQNGGFTLVEVLVAASLMIILAVGILVVFSNVTQRNRGENVRMQALSALQKEVEHYRSLKFIPGAETSADLNNHRAAELRAGTYTRPQITTADGRVFNISAKVDNFPTPPATTTTEELCRFKEIRITATPAVAETGWLSELRTTVTVQRVRAN